MNLRSMTGYGEALVSNQRVEIAVELKSVNHRFLDVSVKAPGVYSKFETNISKMLKNRLRRGRVEVYVARKDLLNPEYHVRINSSLLNEFIDNVRGVLKERRLAERRFLPSVVTHALGRREFMDIVAGEVENPDELELVEKAVAEALERLCEMRSREGKALELELEGLLEQFEGYLNSIESLAQLAPDSFKQRLEARLERIKDVVEVDPERFAQEVALLAERADVTEEITRLRSHLEQFRAVIEADEGGRKLDFLLQEFGREINTIGSKTQNSETTNLVIASKAVVEKIKEQVQNVE